MPRRSHTTKSKRAEPVEDRTCLFCNKTVSRRADLVRHVDTHNVTKRFMCPLSHCQFSASQQSNLEQHIYTHFNHRPYSCTEMGCDYSANNRSSLRRHRLKYHRDSVLAASAMKTEDIASLAEADIPNETEQKAHHARDPARRNIQQKTERFTPYASSSRVTLEALADMKPSVSEWPPVSSSDYECYRECYHWSRSLSPCSVPDFASPLFTDVSLPSAVSSPAYIALSPSPDYASAPSPLDIPSGSEDSWVSDQSCGPRTPPPVSATSLQPYIVEPPTSISTPSGIAADSAQLPPSLDVELVASCDVPIEEFIEGLCLNGGYTDAELNEFAPPIDEMVLWQDAWREYVAMDPVVTVPWSSGLFTNTAVASHHRMWFMNMTSPMRSHGEPRSYTCSWTLPPQIVRARQTRAIVAPLAHLRRHANLHQRSSIPEHDRNGQKLQELSYINTLLSGRGVHRRPNPNVVVDAHWRVI
ncbi:hypothetical protein WOLCODRAFT_146563 [Wolfiporia cocos MD-104 SS10]|uniref:C2H2-type domain-containing protein n=1 Tax=Wolfiporia cocos (strain MD-104) TaxID=742152 RepID=A0A2H3J5D0_WOLCO|nr:hypothetical protein WOLCODRAFT_146563 [Wolfiporia cocos MD-104 SS10]